MTYFIIEHSLLSFKSKKLLICNFESMNISVKYFPKFTVDYIAHSKLGLYLIRNWRVLPEIYWMKQLQAEDVLEWIVFCSRCTYHVHIIKGLLKYRWCIINFLCKTNQFINIKSIICKWVFENYEWFVWFFLDCIKFSLINPNSIILVWSQIIIKDILPYFISLNLHRIES